MLISLAIKAEVTKRHDEAVKRLQDWIKLPSIAAEDLNSKEGAEYMAKLAKDAGFQKAEVIQTDGKPGVFATLGCGGEKHGGALFHVRREAVRSGGVEDGAAAERGRSWTSRDVGKVIVGRGAVNQKGPEAAFLAALHAIKGAGKKMPVNLVLVAEGEEEIGSPHIGQIVHKPEVEAALKKTTGVFMPSASQGLDGVVTVSLGAKGVIEVQLISSGEKWGRGPAKDIHSSLKAMVDSPVWHLVKALDTLVSDDGNSITIENYPKPRALTAEEKKMIADASKAQNEEQRKKQLGRETMDRRSAVGAGAGAFGRTADGEHRGPRRWLHGTGRQDGVAASRGGEARPAPRARDESG